MDAESAMAIAAPLPQPPFNPYEKFYTSDGAPLIRSATVSHALRPKSTIGTAELSTTTTDPPEHHRSKPPKLPQGGVQPQVQREGWTEVGIQRFSSGRAFRLIHKSYGDAKKTPGPDAAHRMDALPPPVVPFPQGGAANSPSICGEKPVLKHPTE